MNYFLIQYRFEREPDHDWHEDIKRFIKALEDDPELNGKIAYRSFRSSDGRYFHIAAAVDEAAAAELNERDFFEAYTAKVEAVGNGTVDVLPLELVAETAFRA
jgi:hypothetical protein